MPGGDVRKIVDKVIEAHGGAARWRKLDAVEAVISVRGFLFKAKRRPILNRVRIRASTREPKFTFFDYPRTWHFLFAQKKLQKSKMGVGYS